MSESYREAVTRLVDHETGADLTESEVEELNSFPTSAVVPILKEMFHTGGNSRAQSRAFDALMKLKDFDSVQFLVGLLEGSEEPPNAPEAKPPDVEDANWQIEWRLAWRITYVERLGRFPDRRSVRKLCEFLRGDPEPYMRSVAAEALGAIGDETAIPVLEYAAEHDDADDGWGFPVSRTAKRALEQIREILRHA